ncbi:DsbA family oxidoreductase [Facklamia miroungae]|uniref:Predicted dithiol-disulfide isomerase, DsbA family n=1 Tax=Facklamia miroungae TaxID=120956 RepID=A0A1G7QAJ6_9LACT|nr:DsbA family oxidoreductase [Facklamia miroungae]NKZ28878.1 DsbA family oxidoreductase [Facklamia miroungae]SDF95465.1 Predicted dithiol-disulfide isomerase, DsbA family [Facklamia miroungae]
MKINYWADYACPYCYIGEVRIKRAIEELGLSDKLHLQMRAYQLDPNASQVAEGDMATRLANKYGITKKEAAERVSGIKEYAIEDGLDFDYTKVRFTNTLDAHRLSKFAMEHLSIKQMADFRMAIYKAYFEEYLELANHEVLLKIAEEAGLNIDQVAECLDSSQYKEEVLKDQQKARAEEVKGVPYFVIGQVTVPGAMSVDTFKDIIKQEVENNHLYEDEE